jgi:hypothetical protein
MPRQYYTPLLTLFARIPPEAWDAKIPQGPLVFNDPSVRVALNPQPLPPREAIAVGAARMAREVARLAVETDLQGGRASAWLADFIDDWCGTPWPHKWPWPLPGPGPDPDPHPWDVAMSRVIGAVVFASVGAGLGEGELKKQLLAGADRLAAAAAEVAEMVES